MTFAQVRSGLSNQLPHHEGSGADAGMSLTTPGLTMARQSLSLEASPDENILLSTLVQENPIAKEGVRRWLPIWG